MSKERDEAVADALVEFADVVVSTPISGHYEHGRLIPNLQETFQTLSVLLHERADLLRHGKPTT